MQEDLKQSVFDLLIVHVIFAAITSVILLLPLALAINVKLLAVVVVYNVLLPVFGQWRNHSDWISAWIFSFILSLLMIFPDWFLAEGLHVLNFIDQSFPMVGAVPLYMAGLWAIPLFIIIYAGEKVTESRNTVSGYITAALLALLIFGAAEASMWMLSSWETLASIVLGNIALYILLPEMILGVSAFFAYGIVKERKLWQKITAAYLVMVLYIGNASLFYLLIEVLLG